MFLLGSSFGLILTLPTYTPFRYKCILHFLRKKDIQTLLLYALIATLMSPIFALSSINNIISPYSRTFLGHITLYFQQIYIVLHIFHILLLCDTLGMVLLSLRVSLVLFLLLVSLLSSFLCLSQLRTYEFFCNVSSLYNWSKS